MNFGLRGLAGNGVKPESFQEPLKSGDAFTERRDVDQPFFWRLLGVD